MSGFYLLNVFKPKGITSFDVIFKLRKKLNVKKIGHSGTLDPMAEGVMQVGVGYGAKILDYLNSNKEYIAEIKFGFESTTLDKEGEITKCKIPPNFSKEDLENTIKDFVGKIEQTPPKFSAIKVGGKKLCDEARKNKDFNIEIPKRTVEIYSIELLEFNQDEYIGKIKVSCSKGTYIRTLAEDISKKLSTKAYLLSLIRTKAGNFKIEESIKIDDIDPKINSINPIYEVVGEKIEINESEYNLVKNGVKINNRFNIKGSEPIFLIFDNKLVSIGNLSDNKIKIKKFFNQSES